MTDNLRIFTQAAEQDVWSSKISHSISILKDEIEPGVVEVINKILYLSKNTNLISNSLDLMRYYLDQDKNIHEKILNKSREIALNDNFSESMRESAIYLVGKLTEWPELAFRKIIESSADKYLKIVTFRSILRQLKINSSIIRQESDKLQYSTDNLDSNYFYNLINQITQTRADGHSDHLNS
jgi:replicative DNA helicase